MAALGCLGASVALWDEKTRTPSREKLSYVAGIASLILMFAMFAVMQ